MPEREITVRIKKPVLCCTHCGRHPATQCELQRKTNNPIPDPQGGTAVARATEATADLCDPCIARIIKLMQPIIPRPRVAKPIALRHLLAPKPKRGRPRKTRPVDDEAARIKAENDAMLGR